MRRIASCGMAPLQSVVTTMQLLDELKENTLAIIVDDPASF